MRKHIILFFSALLFLFSCDDSKQVKGVLGREAMINLLVDVHMVDGFLSNQPNGDSLYHNGTGRYMYVFKKHHTDSATFRKSMMYYTSKPEDMTTMYDDVAKKLQAKLDSINALIAKDNETTRKHMDELAKKKQQSERDSASMLIKKKEKQTQLMLLDEKRRMEMSKPRPLKPKRKQRHHKTQHAQ